MRLCAGPKRCVWRSPATTGAATPPGPALSPAGEACSLDCEACGWATAHAVWQLAQRAGGAADKADKAELSAAERLFVSSLAVLLPLSAPASAPPPFRGGRSSAAAPRFAPAPMRQSHDSDTNAGLLLSYAFFLWAERDKPSEARSPPPTAPAAALNSELPPIPQLRPPALQPPGPGCSSQP